MKLPKISHYTAFRDPLNLRAKGLGITRNALVEGYIQRGLTQPPPEPETLTPGKCCIECVDRQCHFSGGCSSGHETKEEAKQAGDCAKCDECQKHTPAKP